MKIWTHHQSKQEKDETNVYLKHYPKWSMPNNTFSHIAYCLKMKERKSQKTIKHPKTQPYSFRGENYKINLFRLAVFTPNSGDDNMPCFGSVTINYSCFHFLKIAIAFIKTENRSGRSNNQFMESKQRNYETKSTYLVIPNFHIIHFIR